MPSPISFLIALPCVHRTFYFFVRIPITSLSDFFNRTYTIKLNIDISDMIDYS